MQNHAISTETPPNLLAIEHLPFLHGRWRPQRWDVAGGCKTRTPWSRWRPLALLALGVYLDLHPSFSQPRLELQLDRWGYGASRDGLKWPVASSCGQRPVGRQRRGKERCFIHHYCFRPCEFHFTSSYEGLACPVEAGDLGHRLCTREGLKLLSASNRQPATRSTSEEWFSFGISDLCFLVLSLKSLEKGVD